MDSIVIWKLLYTQINLPLQVSFLVVLVYHLLSTMISQLSSQLFQISAFGRRLFTNAVEGLFTRMLSELSVGLTSSHQVLE